MKKIGADNSPHRDAVRAVCIGDMQRNGVESMRETASSSLRWQLIN
ncbi:hypothetical protein [Noviherbaspirillum sp. UKPF54]|nr:hypothetical protein [Noviherbaspirillum sp. UKPF54]